MSVKSIKNVILDVDPGFDDAWAILSMLWAEKYGQIKVRAITTVNGNSTMENVTKNTLRILQAADRLDVPVYKGCAEPLIVKHSQRPEGQTPFHLSDGFCDIEYEHEPDLGVVKNEHAVNAIEQLVRAHDNVTLICVGPLTNLAMLLKLYPGISKELDAVWIMGGNRNGIGNVTSAAEYNFFCDPEAAFIAFERLTCPIYLLPLETVRMMNPVISMAWRFDVVGEHDNKVTKLLNPAEKKQSEMYPGRNWVVYDAVLVACFIAPECIKKMTGFNVTIELGGFYTRGQVVLDHRREKVENVYVIEEFDVEVFQNIILETVKSAK